MSSFNRTPSDCPCFGCHEREIGCHAQCGRYKVWREKRDEMLQARFEYNEACAFSRSSIRKAWKDKLRKDRKK